MPSGAIVTGFALAPRLPRARSEFAQDRSGEGKAIHTKEKEPLETNHAGFTERHRRGSNLCPSGHWQYCCRLIRIMYRLSAQLMAEVECRIRSARPISLFLDFDGTLVPICRNPSAPRLDRETTAALERLAGRDFLVTTLISGRAIEDLYTRTRLEGLIYAGNHGLEIFGRMLSFVEPEAAARRNVLERLCQELAAALGQVPGAILERKGLTASIHYRLAAEADRAFIQQTVYAATARRGHLFRVSPGRKVLDIMPRTAWHKGAAVQWINQRLRVPDASTVYLGDDSSDEDAFSVLPDAVTVKVGAVPLTCARYQLPDTAAVRELVEWLAARP